MPFRIEIHKLGEFLATREGQPGHLPTSSSKALPPESEAELLYRLARSLPLGGIIVTEIDSPFGLDLQIVEGQEIVRFLRSLSKGKSGYAFHLGSHSFVRGSGDSDQLLPTPCLFSQSAMASWLTEEASDPPCSYEMEELVEKFYGFELAVYFLSHKIEELDPLLVPISTEG